MGAPAFQWRHVFNEHKIAVFSANFELYGDISRRITALLATVTPRIEVYSVDESFLDISTLPITDYAAWGRAVRASILKHIGIPVSIGIAPTKTLAKLSASIAKADETYGGAVDWTNASEEWRESALANMPVKEIWGVGWRLAPKLSAESIHTALQLACMRPRHAQQLMGIRGRQMVAELNGTACYSLEHTHKAAQSIMRSRTFGADTNEAHVLESAIAAMAARAAFALRQEGLLARRIGFFTETNRHKPGYRRWSPEITLRQPTNDTGHIISLLVAKLSQIYNRNQYYHRLGVFLYDLVPQHTLQTDIFGQVDTSAHDASTARMQAIDHINQRYGRGKIYYAAEDLDKSWTPKHHIRSPRYVSDWNELPVATIKM